MMESPQQYAEELSSMSDGELLEEKERLLNNITHKYERGHPCAEPFVQKLNYEYLCHLLKALKKRALHDIVISETSVQMGFDSYIPFEPNHDSDDMKNRAVVRAAAMLLKEDKNKILLAQFGNFSGKKNISDLENILFYNIGTSWFEKACRNGIAFCEMPPSRTHGKNFLYRYDMVNADIIANPDTLLAEWSDIPLERFSASLKPTAYFKSFKENWHKIHVVEKKAKVDRFGMRLHIALPKGKAINIAAAMKPMLDGIICAFHPAKTDLSSFCEILSCSKEQLCGDEKCILSPREYLFHYRNSIKWNPEDDLCRSVIITLSKGKCACPMISGCIFEL